MKHRIDYEERFYFALRQILAYMTPDQLRRASEKEYGLEFAESLEYAYDNIRGEAQAALKGYRRKKRREPATATNAEDRK